MQIMAFLLSGLSLVLALLALPVPWLGLARPERWLCLQVAALLGGLALLAWAQAWPVAVVWLSGALWLAVGVAVMPFVLMLFLLPPILTLGG